MRKPQTKYTLWQWMARIGLFLCTTEILLSFVSILANFEAGVWHGNSYRDQLSLQSKMWYQGIQERYPLRGYRYEKSIQSSLNPKIVVLGDSRFYGQYVQPNETFSVFVSTQTDWDVLNLGLPGASMYEANDFILDDAIDYGPQFAILCYDINSSLMSVMTRQQGGSRFDIMRNILRSSMIFRWAELSWYAVSQGSLPVMSVDVYKEELRKGITTLSYAGIEVVVVIGWGMLQDYPDLYTQDRYNEFREASRIVATEMGVEIVEVEELMEGQDTSVMFVGEERIHFSTKGHALFGNHLIDTLGLRKENDK